VVFKSILDHFDFSSDDYFSALSRDFCCASSKVEVIIIALQAFYVKCKLHKRVALSR
jgi:hypothetical protein